MTFGEFCAQRGWLTEFYGDGRVEVRTPFSPREHAHFAAAEFAQVPTEDRWQWAAEAFNAIIQKHCKVSSA